MTTTLWVVMRYFKFMLVMLLALTVAMPQAQAARRHHSSKHGHISTAGATSDPRYADLIMNPVTGEIYHSSDPDGRRYPASLTKMMTLYLLFEALEQHKTTMDARFDVSDYAATMPQTNLALMPGDSIPVETAIKALVVRSANDVAVVVGEALGGDVDHFGEMMTAKAHQLGMSHTVFKNPNGLPNPEQYTTARDMAKLGIALKRDFPQYYHYFGTRQFSWAGVTYYTHNRVMLRYAGTDGIKTGFTGAAGFNLVTSVTRGGRPLVGVVMGGVSGGWRDNRMIQLLDGTYKQIAERGGVRGKMYAANLPLAKDGSKMGIGVSSAAIAAAEQETLANKEDGAVPADEAEDGAASPAAVGDVSDDGSVGAKKPPAVLTSPVTVATPPTFTPAPGEHSASPFEAASLVPPTSAPVSAAPAPPATPLANAKTAPVATVTAPKPAAAVKATNLVWGIQVGAFSSQELAQQSIDQAMRLSPDMLQDAKPAIAAPVAGSAPVHRARLENLSQIQAKKACSALISNHSPCFIYKTGAGSG